MGVLVREFLDVTRMFKRASAPEQSVLFAGQNPIAYNPNDPLPRISVVIIGMTQLLALILGRIRQPRVIAEVIGGILLGPSVMGRIPGFLTNIFPTTSMPVLVLTSDIGIMLFLFLVGMEIDVRVMRRNARASSIISIVGLVVPLGLGAALAVPIYHTFIDDTVNFGYFILFIAVAVGITAFPVLCRILTELKLVETTVGVTVLGFQVIGWILLALSVALVNASNGITALYILLSAVAYVLFLTLPVRWAYHWLARRTGCIEKGQPNLMMMTLTIVIVLVSGFFTDIIGIHPIFGGFVAGIIIPHQNGYAIALVEKIEDLVAVLFLPIYFTISGLRTDLGLLNNGITWGYTILICVVSFFSKFIGCSIAAKLTGFTVRESGAVGSLMACKGLVELIALNVGLQAGILNTRVFSMFVLHALVTTFVTTPLVLLFYPERVRVHADALQGGAVGKIEKGASSGPGGPLSDTVKTTFTMVLDRVEQLPAAMTLAQLLQLPSTGVSASIDFKASDPQITPPSPTETAITVDALRLIELTDRASAVLKSHQADMLARSDPVLNVFRTFGQLNHLNVSTSLSVLGQEDYPLRVVQHVRETGSQMVIFPWTSTLPGNGISDERSDGTGSSSSLLGPFDSMKRDWASPAMPTHFMRGVFKESTADVALFVDRHLSEAKEGQGMFHVFLPFFGGPDDRLALSFVVRLCRRPDVTATVLRIKTGNGEPSSRSSIEVSKYNPSTPQLDSLAYGAFPDTIYDAGDAQGHLQSDTADDAMWSHYTSNELASEIRSRIKFTERSPSRPLEAILESVTVATDGKPQSRLLLVAGRSRRLSSGHEVELRHLCAKSGVAVDLEIFKALGHVAAAMVVGQVPGSLLVLQASTK